MKRATQLFCAFVLVSFALSITRTLASYASDQPAYRHAYYLFLSGTPNGCEDCYVPLLVTKEPLEISAKTTMKAACALIITYERDSIWHNEGIVSVAPDDIEAQPRVIRLRGRKYRYQEINSTEALKLFENPLGTIPISRPLLPNSSPGPTLNDLASAFRDLN
jgi:hypothetical protein